MIAKSDTYMTLNIRRKHIIFMYINSCVYTETDLLIY